MVDTQQAQKDQLTELMKSEAGGFYKTLTDLENDLYGHLQTQNPKGNTKTV